MIKRILKGEVSFEEVGLVVAASYFTIYFLYEIGGLG